MNKPGHVLLGMSTFCAYQKGFIYLYDLIDKIRWEQFVIFYHHKPIISVKTIALLFFLTIIGSIFPDIDLKLKYFFNDPEGKKRYLYHRQFTHSLILWIGMFIYAIYDSNIYLFYFTLGGLSHLLGDMITGSVPILLYGAYYSPIARIGADRIYKNPAFYSKVASLLDKIMVPISGIVIAWCLI